MPCLSGHFDPAQGIFINVTIAKPGKITPTVPLSNLKLPTFTALVDTGATRTCISKTAAGVAELVATGKLPVISATQTVAMDVYLADLLLQFGNLGHLIKNIQIMEFNCPPTSPFQLLLGRDILTRGIFTMSFDGHFLIGT